MRKTTKTLIAGLLAGAALSASATVASAAMNFEGKTIKIVIPYGPGGTYDKYGVVFPTISVNISREPEYHPAAYAGCRWREGDELGSTMCAQGRADHDRAAR